MGDEMTLEEARRLLHRWQQPDTSKIEVGQTADAICVLLSCVDELEAVLESQGRDHDEQTCTLGPLCPWCEISNLQGRAMLDQSRLSAAVALAEALDELIECGDLRGDTDLPHPADDPGLWTARMQEAWDGANAALQRWESEGL